MSKGSNRRPSDVPDDVVRENWERIFQWKKIAQLERDMDEAYLYNQCVKKPDTVKDSDSTQDQNESVK